MTFTRHLSIAGHAPLDLFIFPPAVSQILPARHRTVWSRRGAGLLAHLLKHLETVDPIVKLYAPQFPDTGFSPSSLVEMSQKTNGNALTSWTSDSVRNVNNDLRLYSTTTPLPPDAENQRSVLVFQDGEGPFNTEDTDGILGIVQNGWPSYLVYHMSQTLCRGKVWELVRPKKPKGVIVPADGSTLSSDRLIVIIQAESLREAGMEISHGLSWERTCEDFVKQLGSIGELVTLVMCPHLIVVFGCEGVIYHRGLEASRPTLVFDPLRTEGEFTRQNLKYLPGIMEAFVAGFVKRLVQSNDPDYEGSIKSGLQAARNLARQGIVLHDQNEYLYDASSIMGKSPSFEDATFVTVDIPSNDIGAGETSWSLLDSSIINPAEMARRVVIEGTSNLKIPLARFGDLTLFGRNEIEHFHVLRHSVEEYLQVPQTKPLSLVFFGPAGSGKSFAALQVVESASSCRTIRKLLFDISDFTGFHDLVEVFRQARDCSLKGRVPVVYFKNFDVDFEGAKFGWLNHLLPVMSSGKFFDGSVSIPIDEAILLFGAVVTKDLAGLRRHSDNQTHPFTARTIRNFTGCLQGYVNVSGFNRTDGSDNVYPLRRAVTIRALLEQREPKLKSGDEIRVDESVLSGLLHVPEYRQGIVSLKSILAMSRLNNATHFQRSSLPPPSQLELHLDYKDFEKAMQGRTLHPEVREILAERLNEVYVLHMRETARRIPKNQALSDEQIDKNNSASLWNGLEEIYKDSNRDHADAIPRTLRLISCYLAEKQEDKVPVLSFDEKEINTMAFEEKKRWNSERLQKQWRNGPRVAKDRTSPYLMPWEDLDETTKQIDRAMVSSYARILPENYAIYRMQ